MLHPYRGMTRHAIGGVHLRDLYFASVWPDKFWKISVNPFVAISLSIENAFHPGGLPVNLKYIFRWCHGLDYRY